MGEKTISAASFNLYYNLSKMFSKETKAVLKHDTQQSSGEFLTTDAMKHIVQETKKKMKDCEFLAQKYHIACINTMCRFSGVTNVCERVFTHMFLGIILVEGSCFLFLFLFLF